jgi:polar amino acid transport system substrate-binding protein
VKNIIFLFISILLINALTSCERKQEQSLTIVDGVLTVGVEVGYPPMEYYDIDGITLLGFNIEVINALAEKLGLQVNFIDTAWEGILAGLDAGRYDIAINVTILPERQRRFNFTRPYIDSSMTIVKLKQSSINIEKPEDIAGFKVGYQGSTTAQYFADRLTEQGIVFTSFSYDKIINCLNDLRLGRLDLVIVDNLVASDYAGKENSPFEIIWQGQSDEFIAICLKKGNETLTLALNEALDELFEDGTLQEISMRIFNRDLVSAVRDFTFDNEY